MVKSRWQIVLLLLLFLLLVLILLLIRKNQRHHKRPQTNSVTVEDWVSPLTIAAVLSPKHTIKAEQFQHFNATLGNRFLASGNYNAKHTHWS
jgi:Ca2+/Na+ antiporter